MQTKVCAFLSSGISTAVRAIGAVADSARPRSVPAPKRRRRPRLATALLAALLALPLAPRPAQAQVNLPALGDSVSEDFGIGTERRLGDQIMREVRRDPDYLDDPILDDYLESVWQPLLAASRRKGNIGPDENERFAWEPFLVRDRSVNAFALPGGYVGVHLGMIAVTANRDELASVLAHEMSHVTQRHIARSMVNSQRQGLIGMAAMILGALAATRSSNPDALNAVVVGGQAAAIQGQLNFSRDMEREADRIGFGVMTSAGFAPSGMAAMFEKLQSASRLNDGNSFPYLRSHPLTSDRIGEARARLGAGRAAAAPLSNALEHAVMQARAKVLMDPRAEALQRLQALDAPDNPAQAATAPLAERLSALCASAMASSQLRDAARAEAAVQRALALLRGSPLEHAEAEHAVRLLEVQLLVDRGDPVRAAEALKPFAAEQSRPLAVLRARVALSPALRDSAALQRSAEELQTRVALAPHDATSWGLLGQVQERLGRPLRALRAQAEQSYATGDLSGAVDRLRAGRQAARDGGAQNDFIEASVIEARLRDIEAERKRLAAEMRGEKKGTDDQ